MKLQVLVVCLVASSALVAGRTFERRGRQLLDQSVTLTPENANFNLRVYGIRNSRPTDPCIINGHPGNDWDPVQGPLRVIVPQGVTSQIGFVNSGNEFVQLYSQTNNPELQTQIGERGNDLTGITFTATGSIGSEAFITGARIRGFDGAPVCSLGLTFQVTQPIETPAEPPVEPPAEPSPPPPETVYPKNPCYCQSGNNGGTVCFNFNQATSDINCAPPAGLNCQAGQAEAGQYTQQAGPVYFC